MYSSKLTCFYYVRQDYERMNLADALQSKKFKDGDCIINQVKRLHGQM